MSRRRIDIYGPNADAILSTDRECLLSGPAGTGKSLAWLWKIHTTAEENPGARILMVRKTRTSLTESALVTFEHHVLGERNPILTRSPNLRKVRQAYRYPNGSEIIVGGMDKPERTLSTEYDCLVGETLVDSPSPIVRAYGRPYLGKIVTITTSGGKQLSGTPNHPVFTDKGWIGLDSLNQGDNVVCRRVGEEKIVGGSDPNVANRPAAIAEVASSLAFAESSRTERVVTVPVDFHGDGGNSYVDVVTAGGMLHVADDPASRQHLRELNGGRGNAQHSPMTSSGPLLNSGIGMDAAAVRDASPLAEFGHSRPVGFGIDPLAEIFSPGGVQFSHPFGVDVPDVAKSLPFGLGSDAETASGHLCLESAGTDANGRSGRKNPEFPFEVELDRVVDVRIADAGLGRHVYNLQTGNNWYVANGIISHNCIYIQEVTELEQDEYQTLFRALRAGRVRRNGVPFTQIVSDCNPTFPHHWIYKRWKAGGVRMYSSTHRDNPRFWDRDRNDWTQDGTEYLATLNALTGFLRSRFLDGIWAAAEGLVYDRFGAHNLKPKGWLPHRSWDRFHGIDFGYVNPLVYQFWARDPDGTFYLYREIYRTQMLVEDLAAMVKADIDSGKEPRPRMVIGDHDAEDRATFERHSGMRVQPADKSKLAGIQNAAKMMEPKGPGLPPRLFVVEGCTERLDSRLSKEGKPTSIIEELSAYVWDAERDEPVKENDHSMDVLRYVMFKVSRGPTIIDVRSY